MPFRIGPMEMAIVLLVIMLIFGVGKLPEIGNALGKGLREFRKAQSGTDDLKKSLDVPSESPEEEEKT